MSIPDQRRSRGEALHGLLGRSILKSQALPRGKMITLILRLFALDAPIGSDPQGPCPIMLTRQSATCARGSEMLLIGFCSRARGLQTSFSSMVISSSRWHPSLTTRRWHNHHQLAIVDHSRTAATLVEKVKQEGQARGHRGLPLRRRVSWPISESCKELLRIDQPPAACA